MNSFSISKIARDLAIFTITLFVLGSCEKKANNIGAGFHDGQRFDSGIYRETQILAYTVEKEKIVTSGAPVNLIGAFQEAVTSPIQSSLGMIKSSFGIQFALSEESPNFGTNPVVDSVILTMPYLGRSVGDSTIVYDTDSIYGNKNLPMSFKISRLTKLFYPDSTYYHDTELPTSDVIFDKSDYVFNGDSISLTYIDTTDAGIDTLLRYKIPASFREKLDNNFFQTEILDMQGDPFLATNLNFITNHINGLVFETESNDGAVYTFNMFKNTSLVIYYKNDDSDYNSFPLIFNNALSRVNKYEFDRSSADASLITQINPIYDTTQGSDYIYLQGMSGLEAKIKLFTDDIQLDTLRAQNWIVNRAELVYRVSDDNGNVTAPPFRLIMVNNDSLSVPGSDYRIIDYVYEPTAFDGYLNSDATILSNSEKRFYKFRITNHVSAILDGELKMNDEGEYVVTYDDATNYVIKLISYSGNESVSRVKLNSSNNTMNPTENLFLEIHYSKKDIL